MIHPDLLSLPPDDHPAPVVAYAGVPDRSLRGERHSHVRCQLFHIVAGAVTVETEAGNFIVPPERALWMPSRVPHATIFTPDTQLRFLYFRPDAVDDLPQTPSVIGLSPLFRELISAFMAYPRDYDGQGPAARIVAVMPDQLASEPVAPLHLPMPRSPKLKRALAALLDDPGQDVQLADIASASALSARSFERHFTAETGLSFRAWRKQARLMKAVEWLAQGRPVGEIADRLGYEGPSAFITTFRKAFGTTPGRYFSE